VALWYFTRLESPRPWNTQAIVGSYVDVDGGLIRDPKSSYFLFVYTLQDNTEEDYALNDESLCSTAATSSSASATTTKVVARLRGDLGILNEPDICIDGPLFLPARQRAASSFDSRIGHYLRPPRDASLEVRTSYRNRLAQYLKDQLAPLDGFAIFDTLIATRLTFRGDGTGQSCGTSSSELCVQCRVSHVWPIRQ
jgi:hypothetical protein